MTPEDWVRIKHFRPDEKTPWGTPDAFGNPWKMNLALMMLVECLRVRVGRPIGVHSGFGGKHAVNSQHYIGRAIDCSCPGLSAWDFFIEAIRYDFGGIGVYDRDVWNNPGIHIDVRTRSPIEPRTMWYAYVKEIVNGKKIIGYEYF